MKTASWIVLTLVAALLILGGLGSVMLAYFGSPSDDLIVGETSLADLSIAEDAAVALRGRRGTAGSFALGYGALLLMIILGPYRKGSTWAWWALLVGAVVTSLFIYLRIPGLGIQQGSFTGSFLLIGTLIGLLLDIRRLRAA